MLVGVFEVRDTPARMMSASSQFSDADAVVMGDGELDRVDPGEIGGVERVLAAGARPGLLAELIAASASITGSSTGTAADPALPALPLEHAPDLRIDDRVKHQPGPLSISLEDPVEMPFASAPSARNGGSRLDRRRTGRAQALATISSVSPVESESRWRWSWVIDARRAGPAPSRIAPKP